MSFRHAVDEVAGVIAGPRQYKVQFIGAGPKHGFWYQPAGQRGTNTQYQDWVPLEKARTFPSLNGARSAVRYMISVNQCRPGDCDIVCFALEEIERIHA